MTSLLIAVLSVPAFATYDYTITSGYFGTLTLENSESLLMTGGGYSLRGEDYSILDIRNTSSPVVVGSSGIGSLVVTNYSQLYLSGGQVYQLDTRNYATAVLSGGRIDELRGFYSYADPQHIKIICETYNYNTATKILTGTWLNNSAFSIQLIDTTGYTSTWSNITIIPEPATLLLLFLGGILIRRKK
jgi:hypothetical protein